MYLGLFSRTPNNRLVLRFYGEDPFGTVLFEILFSLQARCRDALKAGQRAFGSSPYSSLFDRYYKDDTPVYRCFVGSLAVCGAVRIDIAERNSDPVFEFVRMRSFLSACTDVLTNDHAALTQSYIYALKVWMAHMMDAGVGEKETRQLMNRQSRGADFSNMYKKVFEPGYGRRVKPSTSISRSRSHRVVNSYGSRTLIRKGAVSICADRGMCETPRI